MRREILHNRNIYIWRKLRCLMTYGALGVIGLIALWVGANIFELYSGQRILPWDPYANCGTSVPQTLPKTIRVGLYEEFPNPWRLAKLQYVDFPVTLAIAAPSRAEFEERRAAILQTYPQVHEVYFWPLLAFKEGYYPGTWSDAAAIRRVAADAKGIPVLWDLELPPKLRHPSIQSWPSNRAFLDHWLRNRKEPVDLWRSYAMMGLDPLFLRLIGMHFDPLEHPAVRLHLDLYAKKPGLSSERMARVLRCGVERYGAQFIPSLGVLNDGEGPASFFITPERLRRDLYLARQAGVGELWLFGVNGLNEAYVSAVRDTIPLESLARAPKARY